MEIKKVNLDRKPLDTEYIRTKQDFQQLIKAYKKTSIPVWKQPLFYGVVGFASLAAVVSFSIFNFNDQEDGLKITSKTQKKSNSPDKVASEYVADLTVSDKSLQISHSEHRVAKENIVGPKPESVKTEPKMVEEDQKSAETVQAPVAKKKKSNFPHINGVSDGEIDFSRFCNSDGVQTFSNLNVRSFNIQYSTGLTENLLKVNGNNIPSNVCSSIEKNGVDQMIYLTDILAEGEEGIVRIPSMSLYVIVKG